MQVFKDKFALYVGGGITPDSISENEWNETVLKSQTLLSVLKNYDCLAI
jgi:isochorismate synthase